MPETKSVIPNDSATMDQLKVLFSSIEQLTEKLGGLKHYKLDDIEQQDLMRHL